MSEKVILIGMESAMISANQLDPLISSATKSFALIEPWSSAR